MTMNELTWVLKRTGHTGAFMGEQVAFRVTTPVRFLPATTEVFAKSVELMQDYNRDYGDAQIAAQAVVNAMDKIASFDTDFDRVPELKRIAALPQARDVYRRSFFLKKSIPSFSSCCITVSVVSAQSGTSTWSLSVLRARGARARPAPRREQYCS
jgi:hypothetical protein